MNPSLREKLWASELTPMMSCCTSGVFYGDVGSQPLLPSLMWPFCLFAQCEGIVHLVFNIFLTEKIVSYVSMDSVCPRQEVSSGSSCVTILNCLLTDILSIIFGWINSQDWLTNSIYQIIEKVMIRWSFLSMVYFFFLEKQVFKKWKNHLKIEAAYLLSAHNMASCEHCEKNGHLNSIFQSPHTSYKHL